jgi:Tol biopolymer transport system component
MAWAIVLQPAPTPRLVLVPTGPGQARTIDHHLETCHQASFLPDGKRVVLVGSEAGHAPRLYVQDLTSASRRTISPEGIAPGVQAVPVSPDGAWIAAVADDWRMHLYPVDGGDPRPVPGAEPGLVPIQWSSDGRYLFAARLDHVPLEIRRVDLQGGQATAWTSFTARDPAGIHGFPSVALTADGRAVAYTYARFLSELYVVTGVR